MALMVVLLLSGAAGTAAISAMGQSGHDRSTKRAVAAADAGLETALYRLNKLKPAALMCVAIGVPTLTLQNAGSNGWCPPVTEDLGDGASYTYRVSAGTTINITGQGPLLQRKIVSTGTANGVSRRAMITAGSLTGVSVFGGNAVTSLTDLTLPTGTSILGDAATDGNMSLQNCGQLTGNGLYGPGKQFTVNGAPSACATHADVESTQHLVLNPVDQGNAATSNDNSRIGAVLGDPFVNVLSTWSPATRVLKLKSVSTLTLTGNTYSFCYLEVDNLAQLIIAARLPTQAPLKIYMDAPENCPGVAASDAGKIRIKSTGQILNLNATSNTFQLFAVGSPDPTKPTSIDFSNTTGNFVGTIYAPYSTVALHNLNTLLGSVAAKTVSLTESARVQWHPSADITLDNLYPLFKRTSWIECASKQSGSLPDSGCG
jgi:hypothetical protein